MAKYDPITEADGFNTGEDKTLSFTVYQEDGVTLQDITGYTLEWQLRLGRDSEAAIITKTGAAITITDGPLGACEVDVDRADSQTFDPGTYWHNLFRTDAGAETVLTYGPALLGRGRR